MTRNGGRLEVSGTLREPGTAAARATTEPVAGRAEPGSGLPSSPVPPAAEPVRPIVPATPWSFDAVCIDRITAILFVRPAIFGKSSQKRTPGVLVGMVPNGPRYSIGAFGFGSHVSSWLGPPQSHNRTTDLAVTCVLPYARCFRTSASESPRTLDAPTCRSARRDRF